MQSHSAETNGIPWHESVHPAKPFAIGLKPLAPDHFLQIDGDSQRFRAEKRQLYTENFQASCRAEPDTLAAQQEATQLILNNLSRFHGSRFTVQRDRTICHDDESVVDLDPKMPLASTALLVPDDLVLMRRDETGWRLVAASLAFPSSWNLAEKFGKPMRAIHAPVPMNEPMHTRIDRIFDGLQPTIPIYRANWSLDPTPDLRLDSVEQERKASRLSLSPSSFLRTEFQTLHKLPISGDILFTIGIRTTALADLAARGGGLEMLTTLRHQLSGMSADEKRYKRLDTESHRLLAWLDDIAGEKTP